MHAFEQTQAQQQQQQMHAPYAQSRMQTAPLSQHPTPQQQQQQQQPPQSYFSSTQQQPSQSYGQMAYGLHEAAHAQYASGPSNVLQSSSGQQSYGRPSMSHLQASKHGPLQAQFDGQRRMAGGGFDDGLDLLEAAPLSASSHGSGVLNGLLFPPPQAASMLLGGGGGSGGDFGLADRSSSPSLPRIGLLSPSSPVGEGLEALGMEQDGLLMASGTVLTNSGSGNTGSTSIGLVHGGGGVGVGGGIWEQSDGPMTEAMLLAQQQSLEAQLKEQRHRMMIMQQQVANQRMHMQAQGSDPNGLQAQQQQQRQQSHPFPSHHPSSHPHHPSQHHHQQQQQLHQLAPHSLQSSSLMHNAQNQHDLMVMQQQQQQQQQMRARQTAHMQQPQPQQQQQSSHQQVSPAHPQPQAQQQMHRQQQAQSHPHPHPLAHPHLQSQSHAVAPAPPRRPPNGGVTPIKLEPSGATPPSGASGAGGDSPHTASKRKRAPSALAIASLESEAVLTRMDKQMQQQQATQRGLESPTPSGIATNSASQKKKKAAAAAAAATASGGPVAAAPVSSRAAAAASSRRASATSPTNSFVSASSSSVQQPAKPGARRAAQQRKPPQSQQPDSDEEEQEEDDEEEGSGSGEEDDPDDSDAEEDDKQSPSPRGGGGRARSSSGGRRSSRGASVGRKVVKALMEESSLKRIRLARKAELARLSRKQKKDRLDELQHDNDQLREQIASLQKQLAASRASAASDQHGDEETGGPRSAKKQGHKDKKMKSEPSPSTPSTPSASNPVQSPTADGHGQSRRGSLLGPPGLPPALQRANSGSGLGSPSPTGSSGGVATATSPVDAVEQLQSEMNAVVEQMMRVLGRNEGGEDGSPDAGAGSSSPSASSPTSPRRGAGHNSGGNSSSACEVVLQALGNRMLELQNSRCLLSAQMSHAYDSLLYNTAAPSSSSTSGLSHGGQFGAVAPFAGGGATANPGLVPMHFFSWLLSQTSSFYTEPAGLWWNLWHNECACTRAQIDAIMQMRREGHFSHDLYGNSGAAGGMGGGIHMHGGSVQPLHALAMPRTARGASSGGALVSGGGGGGGGSPMSDVAAPSLALSPSTMGRRSSRAFPSQSNNGADVSMHSGGGGVGVGPVLGSSSINSVHATLLSSFEHFRSLLTAFEQEELATLQQLLHILRPMQYAKFAKFAVTFGPVVMHSAAAAAAR